jgi:hypothetical protein
LKHRKRDRKETVRAGPSPASWPRWGLTGLSRSQAIWASRADALLGTRLTAADHRQVQPSCRRTARAGTVSHSGPGRERTPGPILTRGDRARLDAHTAHRWVRSTRQRAALDHIHAHMLRAAVIVAALDVGVLMRDVQLAARHADPERPPFTTGAARTSTATPPTPWSPSLPAADSHADPRGHPRRPNAHAASYTTGSIALATIR